MSQCHAIHHPRSRRLLATVNGVLRLLKHHDEDTFKLHSGYGECVGRKSTAKVVDKVVAGKNKVSIAS